jgi:hypothetical protein
MIALIQAIEAYFAGNTPLKAAFPPFNNANTTPACAVNLWQDMLPENAPLPACVYSVVASVANALYPSTNNYAPSENTIRFMIYAMGKNAALTACQTVQAQMDIAVLSLSSGTVSNLLRSSEPIPAWDSKSKTDVDVWGCTITYEIAVDPLP